MTKRKELIERLISVQNHPKNINVDMMVIPFYYDCDAALEARIVYEEQKIAA